MAQMKKKQKHEVQVRNRCQRCGRPRAYMRKFALCRICFRNLALQGYLPGVIKASW
jgi:small subunit ribosomal protein S14